MKVEASMQVDSPSIRADQVPVGDTFVTGAGDVCIRTNADPETAGNVPSVRLNDGLAFEPSGAESVTKVAFKAVPV